jgi:hypothetical protein
MNTEIEVVHVILNISMSPDKKKIFLKCTDFMACIRRPQ